MVNLGLMQLVVLAATLMVVGIGCRFVTRG